jgi:hypothetical protein
MLSLNHPFRHRPPDQFNSSIYPSLLTCNIHYEGSDSRPLPTKNWPIELGDCSSSRGYEVGMVLVHRHDWLPYVGVPALGSATLIVGANGLIAERSFAPYAIAGAMILLLFAGIYGAWDLTLWMINNGTIRGDGWLR